MKTVKKIQGFKICEFTKTDDRGIYKNFNYLIIYPDGSEYPINNIVDAEEVINDYLKEA